MLYEGEAMKMVTTRELDTRMNDGIQVRLLWCEGDRRLSVAVLDTKTRASFSLEVREGERPLTSFITPTRMPLTTTSTRGPSACGGNPRPHSRPERQGIPGHEQPRTAATRVRRKTSPRSIRSVS